MAEIIERSRQTGELNREYIPTIADGLNEFIKEAFKVITRTYEWGNENGYTSVFPSMKMVHNTNPRLCQKISGCNFLASDERQKGLVNLDSHLSPCVVCSTPDCYNNQKVMI